MGKKRKTANKAFQKYKDEDVSIGAEPMETSPLRTIKDVGNPFKGPSGRGLGKAGAKRLGRMLLQAMQPGEELSRKAKVSLPNTPIGLLEYHFQTEANTPSNLDTSSLPSPQVSRFIGQAASKYKSEGGISMAELKQMLAAEGFDADKYKKQANTATKRLISDEAQVQNTRRASFRLRNKGDLLKLDENPVKSLKAKEEKKLNTITKLSKGNDRPQQKGKNTPTPGGKSAKSKSKPNRAPGKSHSQASKTRKPAARLQEKRKHTPKSNRRVLRPAGKKGRAAKNKTKAAQKPLKRTKTAPRRRVNQIQQLYKTRKRQVKRQGQVKRLKSRRCRDTKRAHYRKK